jgi:hypothetical protein
VHSYVDVFHNAGALFNFGDVCEVIPSIKIAEMTRRIIKETQGGLFDALFGGTKTDTGTNDYSKTKGTVHCFSS